MSIRVASIDTAPSFINWQDMIVSILDPKTDVSSLPARNHLRVRAIDTEVLTDPWAPNGDDVDYIFSFVGDSGNILVVCNGGISRSTSVAVGLWCRRGMSVSDAIRLVELDSPRMHPNMLITELIDTYLGAKGEIVAGVRAHMQEKSKGLKLYCGVCRSHFNDGDGKHDCPGWL